jgi:glycosyltransferase involved in cell wall biosynthesis
MLRTGPDGPTDEAKISYHATWLGYLLVPQARELVPTVDVVIPAYNTAATVADAVGSVLSQTYPATRAIVVNDGSTDDIASALAPFSDRILLINKPNGGCGSARNLGITKSDAQLVHFLDSDDLLDRDTIERKVEAIRLIPDAEVCCSSYRSRGHDRHRGEHSHSPTPFGDELCPTKDLLRCAGYRYPFWTTTVMIPRWVLLRTGPMDEDMVNGSDIRYWFRLGLDDAKVIALNVPLATRRFRAGSLTSSKPAHRRAWAVNSLLSIIDILERPSRWTWLGAYAKRLMAGNRWKWLNDSTDTQIRSLITRLEAVIAEMANLDPERGLSSKYPLLVLRHNMRKADRISRSAWGRKSPFWQRMEPVLDSAISRASPLSRADVELWLFALNRVGSYGESASAYAEILLETEPGKNRIDPLVSTDEWDRIAQWAPDLPPVVRRRIRKRLAPKLGEKRAESIACLVATAVAVQRSFDEYIFDLRTRWQIRTRLKAALQATITRLAGQGGETAV